MQLGIKGVEFIFPDSENVLLDAATMKRYQERYTRIVVLFDSDTAGIEATKKYEEKYKTESVYLNMTGGKDIADFVAKHGVEKVRTELIKLLK
jgi:DNA primase